MLVQRDIPQRNGLHKARVALVGSRSHDDQVRRTDAQGVDWAAVDRHNVCSPSVFQYVY